MDPTRLAQLKDYVKQSRDAGQTYDQVRAAILGGGWTEDDVNEYLPAAWAETEPTAAAPAPVVAPPVVAPSTPVVAPTTPVVPPTYATPGAAPGYGAPAAPVGAGLGAWISKGWEMLMSDAGTIIVAVLVAALIGAFSLCICLPPLSLGLFRMLLKKHDGQPVTINDVFEGFRYFWSAWGVMALAFLAGFVLSIPLGILTAIAGRGGDATTGVALVSQGLGAIIGFAVGTFLLFAFPFIADDRGGAIEAITASVNAVKEDFWTYLIAVIVAQVIGAAGLIACGIGALFTAPLTACITTAIYRSRFPAGTMRV
jgi:hypothetical protein